MSKMSQMHHEWDITSLRAVTRQLGGDTQREVSYVRAQVFRIFTVLSTLWGIKNLVGGAIQLWRTIAKKPAPLQPIPVSNPSPPPSKKAVISHKTWELLLSKLTQWVIEALLRKR